MVVVPGMQEVFCRDCGISLGFQQADVLIDPRNWTHNRCPVWIANRFGISRQEYDYLLAWLSQVIAGAYPEVDHGRADTELAKLRGEIAAGHVMEMLAGRGYTIVRKDEDAPTTPEHSDRVQVRGVLPEPES